LAIDQAAYFSSIGDTPAAKANLDYWKKNVDVQSFKTIGEKTRKADYRVTSRDRPVPRGGSGSNRPVVLYGSDVANKRRFGGRAGNSYFMKFEKLRIEGLILIQLSINGDARGFFTERFKRSLFKMHGLPVDFVQDNHSRSAPRVLRGLHYQYSPSQGKLVGVTRGKIWDVAVDMRPNSATFGENHGVELSDMNGLLLWIPRGFAHGFCVLGDESADVLYKTDAEYNASAENGIVWSDPELAIGWPLECPTVSERDTGLQSFKEYRAHPVEWQ
jgi:dTDP-4-dehydrorhamnose 3,5-epimerase